MKNGYGAKQYKCYAHRSLPKIRKVTTVQTQEDITCTVKQLKIGGTNKNFYRLVEKSNILFS